MLGFMFIRKREFKYRLNEYYLRGRNHGTVYARDLYQKPEFMYVNSQGKRGKKKVGFLEYRKLLDAECKYTYDACKQWGKKKEK